MILKIIKNKINIKNNLLTLIFNHLQKSYNKSICRLNYKGFKQYSLLNVFSV